MVEEIFKNIFLEAIVRPNTQHYPKNIFLKAIAE